MINKVYGLLGLATRAGKVTFGTDACIEAIEKNKIRLVIIATDASERLKSKFKNQCDTRTIKIIEIGTIEQLSKSIGKINKAVIGVRDINFSNEIIKIISGGEFIG